MHILEKRCPLLIAGGSADAGGADGADAAALKKELESPDVAVKLRAMKSVILASLNGGTPPNVLMTVIRFVMPVDDHDIKRILLLYWETVEKTDAQGKLLPEMILVWYVAASDHRRRAPRRSARPAAARAAPGQWLAAVPLLRFAALLLGCCRPTVRSCGRARQRRVTSAAAVFFPRRHAPPRRCSAAAHCPAGQPFSAL